MPQFYSPFNQDAQQKYYTQVDLVTVGPLSLQHAYTGCRFFFLGWEVKVLKELISNGNFELWCTPTWPLFWEVSNTAGASENSYSGCWSVQLSPCRGSTLMQTVSIKPGCCHQLSYYLRCLEGDALAAARVEWLDSEGNCLGLGGEQISELNTAEHQHWIRYQILLSPIPTGCTWARVSFSARGGKILLDQVSLAAV